MTKLRFRSSMSLDATSMSSCKQFPPEKHERLINAHLRSGAIDISATDWMASPAFEPVQGNAFAIFIVGQAYDKLKTVFDRLSEVASKEWFQELHEMPFGTYGQFFDRFGVQWIFRGDKREWLTGYRRRARSRSDGVQLRKPKRCSHPESLPMPRQRVRHW